jgi:tetratricopeptide (TPR) repeat protein
MKKRMFIGREQELDALLAAAQDAASRRGSVLFIEGGMGSGKTTLVEELTRRLSDVPELEGLGPLTGHCYAGGQTSSYFPFIEALSQSIARGGERRNVSKFALNLMNKVGPDLLRIIPVLGDAAAAAFNAGKEFWFRSALDGDLGISGNIALQFTDTITELAKEEAPLLLVLEDIHWGDGASAQLLQLLSQRMQDLPLYIVATYRPDELKANAAFASARRDLITSGRGTIIPLHSFTGDEISRYLTTLYGTGVAEVMADWLLDLSGGQPLFVARYLDLLVQNGSLVLGAGDDRGWRLDNRLSELPEPDGVRAIIEDRLGRIVQEKNQLLQRCAVQGHRFYSAIAAKVEETDEMIIVDTLKGIAEGESFITLSPSEPWTADWTDTFTFSDQLTRLSLYSKQTDRQKTLLHRQIGEDLQERLSGVMQPPSHMLIEAAGHLDSGRQWEAASGLYLRAAQMSFELGAFHDTAQLCEKAISALARVPGELAPEFRQLRAECIKYLLLSSEMGWWGSTEISDAPGSPFALLKQAEDDVESIGDLSLRAQFTTIRAKVTGMQGSLPEAVKLYEQAVDEARAAEDELGELAAMTELGHNLVGVDHAKGLAILKQADAKWERLDAGFQKDILPGTLARHRFRLQGLIGVGEFDNGNFDTSERRLRSALDGLRYSRMTDLSSLMTNFLAQLFIAEGRFEEAERVLVDAIDTLKSERAAIVHRGYNVSLLGKLYLEWGRIDQAADHLVRAFETTRDTRNEPVLPLIRNYYSELLLHPAYPLRDMEAAEGLLHETIADVSASGFIRSEVMAKVLLSRMHLDQGAPGSAVTYSKEAADTLDRYGMLPAVRSEEVWYWHGVCLQANGQEEPAAGYFRRARDVVVSKAASIADESRRYQYLERIALNRLVRASANRTTAM